MHPTGMRGVFVIGLKFHTNRDAYVIVPSALAEDVVPIVGCLKLGV